ncbi:MAG: type 4b pilus protein PilO2 [Alphaproteobacteria bacterium]|nr:type 4b pilus protein PilO2 [Alphaproteobacteria bacterium]MBN2674951.1 type 4b pilus protein PilO2 [Alphaproteobacteria bacterium]
MVNQVILIDRKKYAVGLFWQPVAVGFIGRNYAHQLAKGIERKLGFYTEYRAMVGLGSRRVGHHIGMPSAAAEVMEAFAEFSSFLAAFKTQDFFWLVAVRNGIIIYDYLFDSEDEARGEYIKMSAMPDWGSFFAPSYWEIPRSVEKKLEDIVFGNVKAVLKPISRLKADFISLIILIVFILGLGNFFKEPISQMLVPKPQISKIDPILAQEYKKKIEEKNKELDKKFEIQKAKPQEPLKMPYDYLPDPSQRAKLCYQAIGFLMQPIAGWNQVDVECNEAYANVIFKRKFGNLGDFYEIATDLLPGVFVEEKSESEIFVRAKLPDLKMSSSLEEKDPETIVREVNTIFQKINTPVDINITVDTVGNETKSVNLNVVEVGSSSKLTPPEFIKIFNDLHGVYMTRSSWDAVSKEWNYEVIIYAK